MSKVVKPKQDESHSNFVARIIEQNGEEVGIAMAIAGGADELARGNALAEAEFALSLEEEDEGDEGEEDE
jgi:hypothetical protein